MAKKREKKTAKKIVKKAAKRVAKKATNNAPIKRKKGACKGCGRKGVNSRTCRGTPESHDQ